MTALIRRALTRRGQRTGSGREPATDWRVTMKRRVVVAAALLGVWAAGIEARLVKLQVIDHADLGAGQRPSRHRLVDQAILLIHVRHSTLSPRARRHGACFGEPVARENLAAKGLFEAIDQMHRCRRAADENLVHAG